MATDQAAVGTVERIEDATNKTEFVRIWLDAISISGNEEEGWRKDAQSAFDLYRQSADKASTHSANKKFNIFHANVETICPALYNSTPIPDVRRRFNDSDPIAKTVADIQERCLQYSVESYDFDHIMKLAVKDGEICGRSVDRVRYKPYVGKDNTLDYQEVTCEHVPWKHFRRGPGHLWDDVSWVAFELFLTRDELEKLSPKFGSKVNLDVSVNRPNDATEDRNIPEIFKRARVWEIWDKDNRKVIFIAESFKSEPIREESDPYELEGFFPIPRPLYAIQTSNSLIPIVPYEIYKAQAEELELISQRIISLTEAIKARSIYDGRIASEMERLESAETTDSIPLENPAMWADGSKLADHVMFYPIEVFVVALEKLYLARDQIKATIYEITGISDILRGESQASETATAQNIKQQWGSLRIQNKQAEIARYARDIFRIKADLFASKFEPQFLEMMTGIKLMPDPANPESAAQSEAVIQMLRSDRNRGFRVDVESDSTIRADLTRNQQNMTLFLQGTAQFAQAMGPIVMTFKSMTPAVIDVYSSFARNFKLGKQAEDALDKLGTLAAQEAQQPEKPSPEQRAEQAKLQMEQQKLQADQQAKQAELQMKVQESQAKIAADAEANQQKLAFEAQKHEQEMQFEREKHQNDMQMRAHESEVNTQLTREKNDTDAQVKREQIEASKEPRTTIKIDPHAAMQEAMGSHMQTIEAAQRQASQNAENALTEIAQQATALSKQLESLSDEMSAPVEIMRDKSGRAAGVRKGKRTMTIKRGADGRAQGLQ